MKHFPPYNTFLMSRNIASLSCYYLHSKLSNELHSLFPIVLTITIIAHHDTYEGSNHSYSVRIAPVRKRFYLASSQERLVWRTAPIKSLLLRSLQSQLLCLALSILPNLKVCFLLRLYSSLCNLLRSYIW